MRRDGRCPNCGYKEGEKTYLPCMVCGFYLPHPDKNGLPFLGPGMHPLAAKFIEQMVANEALVSQAGTSA